MSLLRAAALNNARWCDVVCRAHGLTPGFCGGLWHSNGAPPRWYPHAVTLEPGAEAQVAALRPPSFKDSFADVDGARLGYALLFRATWLWCATPPTVGPAISQVTTERGLQAWEAAWSGGDSSQPRQFPPSLLALPEAAFFHDESRGAGCIVNASEGVAGLTNAFGLEGWPGAWETLMAAAARCFPGCALAGYERGEALPAALSAGFGAVGELAVWAFTSTSER